MPAHYIYKISDTTTFWIAKKTPSSPPSAEGPEKRKIDVHINAPRGYVNDNIKYTCCCGYAQLSSRVRLSLLELGVRG